MIEPFIPSTLAIALAAGAFGAAGLPAILALGLVAEDAVKRPERRAQLRPPRTIHPLKAQRLRTRPPRAAPIPAGAANENFGA